MNTQEIGFSEIMEGLTLFFIAALLLGFILVASKVVYLLMIEYKEKRKTKEAIDYEHEAIDYEKEAQELMRKLSVHKDVKYLDVYDSDQDDHWEYYYRILGIYKGVQFLIYINKHHETAIKIQLDIRKHPIKDVKEIQTFLKTLTNLKFELS
jgi:hypothetical protein